MVSARAIINKKQYAGMEDTHKDLTENIAKQELNNLFTKYKAHLKNATELRQIFQYELAKRRSKEGDTKIATEVEIIERTETQRISAARIR